MKEAIQHLQNKGMVFIGDPIETKFKTIIILGVGRGGTSLCSKAINKLGVPTGKDSRPPVYEDIPLSKALENHDLRLAESIINDYNTTFDTWAFKRPTTNDTINELHNLARNPVYVVVFRDLLSIANRNNLSMNANLFETMHESLRNYEKIINFLSNKKPRALLVSYEKALIYKSMFVDYLADLINTPSTFKSENKINAINSIQESPKDYVINTSAVHYYGYIDTVSNNQISGWAAYNQTDQLVPLDLYINGKLTQTLSPVHYREDIKTKGIHPTGLCGYSIQLSGKNRLSSGDQVSIKFSATGEELRNSPWIVK